MLVFDDICSEINGQTKAGAVFDVRFITISNFRTYMRAVTPIHFRFWAGHLPNEGGVIDSQLREDGLC